MFNVKCHPGRDFVLSACLLAALCAGAAHAEQSVNEQREADPHGYVEISNISGEIEVIGWDKPSVLVTGSAGDDVERVDVSGHGDHVTVHVIPRSGHTGWGSSNGAHLKLQIPRGSTVSSSLVSSKFQISTVQGDLKVQSVSGDIVGDAGGDIRVNTVSGKIRMTAHGAKRMDLSSVSGNINLAGGDGETNVTTVSGQVIVIVGRQSRARFKSVSGNLTATLGMDADARVEAESVSGDVRFSFAGKPSGDFDVQSFSGKIDNCFGPKPVQPQYGPGSRLSFKDGGGDSRVRIGTQSGNVHLCTSA
jgi:hypothetical protein